MNYDESGFFQGDEADIDLVDSSSEVPLPAATTNQGGGNTTSSFVVIGGLALLLFLLTRD